MNLPERHKKKEERERELKFKYDTGERQIYITVGLFFFGVFTASIFGFKTLIGLFDFFKILILFIVLSIAVVQLFFRSAFTMKTMEKVALAAIGLAPATFGLFFALNYFISLKTTYYSGTIENLKTASGRFRFEMSSFPCDQYPEACIIDEFEHSIPSRGDSIYMQTSKGIFGYEVLKDLRWVDLSLTH